MSLHALSLQLRDEAFRLSPNSEAALPCADAEAFRAAMRNLASGVCLIAHGAEGTRVGMTATAVTSLSTEPPSLVVCINKTASSFVGLVAGVAFSVNVLGAHQEEYADRFAGRTGLKGEARFTEGPWLTSPRGAPWLADSLATFECAVEDIVERHTHAIVVARVTGAASRRQGSALVHWRGAYDALGWSDDEILRAVGVTPSTSASRLRAANSHE